MKLEIREMLYQDLEMVAELEQTLFSMPWSRRGFADSLSQKDTLYIVALEHRQIVGYSGMMQVLDEADITNVAVAKEHWGRGIATAMLSALMERGKHRGVSAYTLEVRESNASAIHLYEKLGFVKVGIRKNFYEKPVENAVIMWK